MFKDRILQLNHTISKYGEEITRNMINRKRNEYKTHGLVLKKETYQ